VTGPARDFTIVADDEFISTSLAYNGTTVNSWYLPGEETNGEAVAEFARRSLEYYSTLIGTYPYAELDVVSVEVYGALGVEFPQLVYMARDYYSRDIDLDAPSNLEFTVSHEVLHQWFYGMIGNNQYEHAFIDEGLTQYISGDPYFRHVYGDAAGAEFSNTAFRNTYANGIANRGDRTIVDTPSDSFNSSADYVFAMYYKAPMGFDAMLDAIGEDAFAAALQSYFRDFRFGVAQPDDLLHAFETASGQDLADLWYRWFESTAG
jgi:aminopeptidase N